ncbi:MAG TPA: hypothetical protein VGU25_01850 [Acidobacteriaceae bacterium]|nr:hypothetical protein [Acidobacteriaceae bacterium]
MAVQKSPHTNSEQNVSSAAMDLEPNLNPQDVGRGEDAKLYENADGAQTGANRAFHMNDRRDNLPKSIDEGTRLEAENTARKQHEDMPGVTTHSAGEENKRQQKVERNNE